MVIFNGRPFCLFFSCSVLMFELHQEIRGRCRASKTELVLSHPHPHPLLSFPTDRYKVVSLLQLFFVRASVVSYVTFVPSFCFCLGKVVLRQCGISWLSSLIQSTLVISNSKGLFEILRDIRTLTYQICRIEGKHNHINKYICN